MQSNNFHMKCYWHYKKSWHYISYDYLTVVTSHHFQSDAWLDVSESLSTLDK